MGSSSSGISFVSLGFRKGFFKSLRNQLPRPFPMLPVSFMVRRKNLRKTSRVGVQQNGAIVAMVSLSHFWSWICFRWFFLKMDSTMGFITMGFTTSWENIFFTSSANQVMLFLLLWLGGLGVPYNPILWLKKIKHKPTHVEQIYTIYKWSFSSTQKSHFCCSISESQGFDGLNLEGRSLEDGTLVDVSRGSHPHLETPFI